jgi:hypothetical protein
LTNRLRKSDRLASFWWEEILLKEWFGPKVP